MKQNPNMATTKIYSLLHHKVSIRSIYIMCTWSNSAAHQSWQSLIHLVMNI